MRLVSGEVVPEMLEICPLAALHQGFGGRTIKTKMPDTRIIIHILPSGHTWEKSIHHHELLRFRWKLRSIRISNHKSYVVTDDSRFPDAQGLGECVNSDSSGLHIQTVCRNLRIADPREVGCNHGKLLGKKRIRRFHIRDVCV